MVVGAAGYERELRRLLEGDGPTLLRYTRHLTGPDREVLGRLKEAPFLVVRGAGSLGFDLVALRREFAFPFEVKASAADTIRFSAASGRASAQLKAHRSAVDRVGLVVLYAYRRLGNPDGEPWRIFIAPGPDGTGWRRILRRRVPTLELSPEGHGILRWDDGLPFVRFAELVIGVTDVPATAAG